MSEPKSFRERLDSLRILRRDLMVVKTAFMATPPMPGGGGAPPMDPAMMGQPMPGGMPMDPAMAGGAPPPMDPAMAGMPMDPAMAGGAPPMDPAMGAPGPPPEGGAVTPEMVEQILAILEELATDSEATAAQLQALEGQVQEVGAKLEEFEQDLAAAAAQTKQPLEFS